MNAFIHLNEWQRKPFVNEQDFVRRYVSSVIILVSQVHLKTRVTSFFFAEY